MPALDYAAFQHGVHSKCFLKLIKISAERCHWLKQQRYQSLSLPAFPSVQFILINPVSLWKNILHVLSFLSVLQVQKLVPS